MDAHIAKIFDRDAAGDWLQQSLLTSSYFMATTAPFVKRGMSIGMEEKKIVAVVAENELISPLEGCNRVMKVLSSPSDLHERQNVAWKSSKRCSKRRHSKVTLKQHSSTSKFSKEKYDSRSESKS